MIGAASSLSGQEKSTDVIHSPQNWGYLVSLLPGIVSRMARLLRYVAVVALVGGATASLTACSGDPGPIVTESPSLTRTVEATPSPSPTPTLTSEEELLAQIPEDARGEDFYSASQFAKYFWSQYPRLFDQGSAGETAASLWDVVSDEGCAFCGSALASSTDMAAEGQYRRGNEFTWTSELGTGGLSDDGFTYVNLDGTISEVQTVDAAGYVVDEEDGFKGTFGVQLQYAQDHWVVFGAEFQIHE